VLFWIGNKRKEKKRNLRNDDLAWSINTIKENEIKLLDSRIMDSGCPKS